MPQNIYDNEEFFKGYSRLRRSVGGLDEAPEWPSLRSMLPDLRGASVLDLGRGYGWFCRWARHNGAARVLGVDLSEKMLARAAEMTSDAGIEYTRGNMENLEFPPGSFNLVYSSLAFHYIENLGQLMAHIHEWLVPGGSLVFSAEHPIYTAPANPGWFVDAAGKKSWPVNSYQDEGPRSTDWLAKGVIKQHRTIGTCFNMLLANGFVVSRIEEWGPTEEQIAARPDLAEERERPMFVLFAAHRQ